MQSLPRIPTPPSQRWKEFRIQGLPIIMFCCLLVATGYLWLNTVAPPTLTGEVEQTQAYVTSPEEGILTNLWVTRFQQVKQGDIVGEVIATDLDTQIQTLRGKISATQLELGTFLDRERLAFDYQGLRLDYLRQRVDLATAKVDLQRAENDLARDQKLFEEKLISAAQYDLTLKTKDALAARVGETAALVQETEEWLNLAKPLVQNPIEGSPQEVARVLKDLQTDKTRLFAQEGKAVALRAPIDGVVSMVHRRAGENIMPGEPIITISATQGERIIGYLKQPFSFVPREGMEVRVRARTFKREEAWAKILQVGKSMEMISPTLMRAGEVSSNGLPIAVSIPVSLKSQLIPGEAVDLTIKYR